MTALIITASNLNSLKVRFHSRYTPICIETFDMCFLHFSQFIVLLPNLLYFYFKMCTLQSRQHCGDVSRDAATLSFLTREGSNNRNKEFPQNFQIRYDDLSLCQTGGQFAPLTFKPRHFWLFLCLYFVSLKYFVQTMQRWLTFWPEAPRETNFNLALHALLCGSGLQCSQVAQS